jgi:hypothetical protein
MPATQISSKEDLCALSQQLKSRLEAAGRGRKAGLSTEFLEELLGALDHLSELSSEAADLPSDTVQETCPLEPTVVHAPIQPSISEVDLSRVVADAVASSLAAWQTQFATNIAQVIATNSPAVVGQTDPDERTALLLSTELSDTRLQLSAANDQLSECQLELKRCRAQLEKAEHRIAEVEIEPLHISGNDDDLSDQLKLQLEDTLNELADLREQNSDLAARLAQQVANSVTYDGSVGRGNDAQLTWEQRKLLILKQLEGDTSIGSAAIPHHDKVEIQEIIDASQLEIARRDEEIEELREIVRMQSDARAGVAIGAAGLAEILDSNELIQQERQRLCEIQQEWEAKLRQAEIDLSMERAKIARERIAIDKQKEELTHLQLNSPPPKEKTVERRWSRIFGRSQADDEQASNQ